MKIGLILIIFFAIGLIWFWPKSGQEKPAPTKILATEGVETLKEPLGITALPNQSLGAVNETTPTVKNNQTTYKSVYNGVDLIYTKTKDKILEEYLLKYPPLKPVTEIVQKIDIAGLTYKKQVDGSIIFFKDNKFTFAIPRPVMYEYYNSHNRNYGLHYEISEQNGSTFLTKVIDSTGQEWLKKSNYPLVIDATIVLTLFGFESYPVVDNVWQIRLDTVGQGDLIISASDYQLACDGVNTPSQNFFCSGLAIITTTPQDLKISYGDYTTTIPKPEYTGKPIFLSASVTPPTPKVGDTLTIKAEIYDQVGIKKVTALVNNEVINLTGNGTYEGTWQVINTTFKQYPVVITATNNNGTSEEMTLTFFDAYTCLGGGDHGNADWNPGTDCAGGNFAGTHTGIAGFNVTTTANVQAFDNWAHAEYGFATVSATTVSITGTLNAAAKGYAGGVARGGTGSGPGGGIGCSESFCKGGGGAHGGAGGAGQDGLSAGGSAYESALVSSTLGSGGGASRDTVGGVGGGGIKITTTGAVTISGTVTTDGGSNGNYPGSGAGGSVFISSGTSFNGTTGTVRSNGGGVAYGGGGGGGRIIIKYGTTYTAPSTLTVAGGVPSSSFAGSAGTLVLIDTGNNDLYINSSQNWYANPSFEGQTFTYRNVNVQSNSSWTLYGYSTSNTNGVGQTFNVANFTIATGSSILLKGGYAGGAVSSNGSGTGGGKGDCGFNCKGGGAGYGGVGGTGQDGHAGGTTYGSSILPEDLGSGGGGGWYVGANGGGAIRITASSDVTIWGTLIANGDNDANNYGGGGSGGSVLITTSTLDGGGTISANGGSGLSYGGGGGGGRIAIYYTSANNWTGNTLSAAVATAKGTTGGGAAADGTVTVAQKSAPTISSLAQYQTDCTTSISSGGSLESTTGCFKATITDADGASDRSMLQIETLANGSAFTNTYSASGSGEIASATGVTASVSQAGFVVGTQYHWQARAIDQYGNTSAWTAMGGNPDFVDTTAAPTNDSLTFTNPRSTNDALCDDSTVWNFRAVVSNTDGYAELNTVVLELVNAGTLKFTWTESTDTFSETTDTQNAATLTSTNADSTCAGNTCTLDFKVKFNNNFSAKVTNYNAQLVSTDDSTATDTDTYTNFYQVIYLPPAVNFQGGINMRGINIH